MSAKYPDDHRSIVRRGRRPQSASHPVVSPISPSVVYASVDADALDDQYEGRTQGYAYAREGHPNWTVLADKLDWMEGVPAESGGGVITASGMAAVGAVFQAVLKTGDHLVAGNQLYGRTLRLLKDEMPRIGVEVTLADPADGAAFAAAIGPRTRMVLVEVVSNPTLRVADMTAIAAACRDNGVLLVVDNTFTTPRVYRPFAEGADVVIHSVTKMLAGHSDVTLGYMAARDADLGRRLYDVAVTWGLTPSPFDCWLAERGLHSFEVRFERAQANAASLADHLAGLEGIEAVLYPGREDHPDHARAMALLGGQGGTMVSFRLRGGRDEVNRFLRAAEHIPFAPTLGDIGTTLSHPASSSHRGLSPEGRAELGITEGFIRVSVGIEEISLLKDEFTAAVAASSGGVAVAAPAAAEPGDEAEAGRPCKNSEPEMNIAPEPATASDRTRVFGPVLLFIHFLIATVGWVIALGWGTDDATTPVEIWVSVLVAVAMLFPVFSVVRAFFREKVRVVPTILYMLCHVGLVIVGYAAIFSMLSYGGANCTEMLGRDLYFSAVTFTTLGYGDCAPVGVTRGFAAFEALLSYVFVGVVVGLIANLERNHRAG